MRERAKAERRERGRIPIPRAILSIALAAAVVLLLIVLATHEGAIGGIQRAYAAVTHGVLRLLGHDTAILGNVVRSSNFGITVVTACTGIFATALFLVAVLVFPTTWRAKLLGGILGIGGIAVVNVVRLVTLYYVGVHWPAALDAVHQLVWQSLLIVFAVSLWLLWAGRIAGRRGAER